MFTLGPLVSSFSDFSLICSKATCVFRYTTIGVSLDMYATSVRPESWQKFRIVKNKEVYMARRVLFSALMLSNTSGIHRGVAWPSGKYV